eukprot:2628032-Karenia_brevis.AAC.1
MAVENMALAKDEAMETGLGARSLSLIVTARHVAPQLVMGTNTIRRCQRSISRTTSCIGCRVPFQAENTVPSSTKLGVE